MKDKKMKKVYFLAFMLLITFTPTWGELTKNAYKDLERLTEIMGLEALNKNHSRATLCAGQIAEILMNGRTTNPTLLPSDPSMKIKNRMGKNVEAGTLQGKQPIILTREGGNYNISLHMLFCHQLNAFNPSHPKLDRHDLSYLIDKPKGEIIETIGENFYGFSYKTATSSQREIMMNALCMLAAVRSKLKDISWTRDIIEPVLNGINIGGQLPLQDDKLTKHRQLVRSIYYELIGNKSVAESIMQGHHKSYANLKEFLQKYNYYEKNRAFRKAIGLTYSAPTSMKDYIQELDIDTRSQETKIKEEKITHNVISTVLRDLNELVEKGDIVGENVEKLQKLLIKIPASQHNPVCGKVTNLLNFNKALPKDVIQELKDEVKKIMLEFEALIKEREYRKADNQVILLQESKRVLDEGCVALPIPIIYRGGYFTDLRDFVNVIPTALPWVKSFLVEPQWVRHIREVRNGTRKYLPTDFLKAYASIVNLKKVYPDFKIVCTDSRLDEEITNHLFDSSYLDSENQQKIEEWKSMALSYDDKDDYYNIDTMQKTDSVETIVKILIKDMFLNISKEGFTSYYGIRNLLNKLYIIPQGQAIISDCLSKKEIQDLVPHSFPKKSWKKLDEYMRERLSFCTHTLGEIKEKYKDQLREGKLPFLHHFINQPTLKGIEEDLFPALLQAAYQGDKIVLEIIKGFGGTDQNILENVLKKSKKISWDLQGKRIPRALEILTLAQEIRNESSRRNIISKIQNVLKITPASEKSFTDSSYEGFLVFVSKTSPALYEQATLGNREAVLILLELSKIKAFRTIFQTHKIERNVLNKKAILLIRKEMHRLKTLFDEQLKDDSVKSKYDNVELKSYKESLNTFNEVIDSDDFNPLDRAVPFLIHQIYDGMYDGMVEIKKISRNILMLMDYFPEFQISLESLFKINRNSLPAAFKERTSWNQFRIENSLVYKIWFIGEKSF